MALPLAEEPLARGRDVSSYISVALFDDCKITWIHCTALNRSAITVSMHKFA